MDKWGIIILAIFTVLYFLTKKKYPSFLFLAGIGAGIIIGAVWAMYIFNNAIDTFLP